MIGVSKVCQRPASHRCQGTQQKEHGMHKALLSIAAVLLLIPAAAPAEFLSEDKLALRVDAILDTDTTDDPTWGIQLGFGTALFPMDEVGLMVGYREDDDQTLKDASLYIEEHYRTGTPIYPFAGVAVGFAWYDPEAVGAEEEESWFLRLSAGVKIALADWVAVSVAAQYSIALNDDIFLDDDGQLDDTNLEFVAGLRFYY
jgi:hypothetical protein